MVRIFVGQQCKDGQNGMENGKHLGDGERDTQEKDQGFWILFKCDEKPLKT